MTDTANLNQRAALYLRVASPDPRDHQAIAHQREGCMRIAAKHGLNVVREYVDLGQPAQPANAPSKSLSLLLDEGLRPDGALTRLCRQN